MPESQSLLETEVQKINLHQFSGEGLILDIGGGGEGLVSRIEGDRTCALDIRMSEIKEAQIHGQSSNWFVADGANLCFSDGVFDIVGRGAGQLQGFVHMVAHGRVLLRVFRYA